MSGDRELFEMMRNRGSGGELPTCDAMAVVPKRLAVVPKRLAVAAKKLEPIDERIQKIMRYRPWIIAGAILLAFLIGTAL